MNKFLLGLTVTSLSTAFCTIVYAADAHLQLERLEKINQRLIRLVATDVLTAAVQAVDAQIAIEREIRSVRVPNDIRDLTNNS